MAEPPTISPAEGAPPERDVLVATKFHVPPCGLRAAPPAAGAPGPRRWAAGSRVVCTPAGFGKTTLLGDWARRSRRSAAWLSLDAADNDPARFWRYVAAALDRVRPGVGEQVEALLRGPEQPPLEAVATTVINELTRPPVRSGHAVLDDYHLIEASAVHASVAFLVDRLPPGLRLVLASRADPPLPLARLRARGQLAELRAARPALHAGRDGRVPAGDHRAGPSGGVGGRLQDRTEGWAAGVQLAALSLRGHADPAAFRGDVRRQPPVRAGLPDRGGPGPPARAAGPLPAGDFGAGAAVGPSVRRRHRTPGQPAAAGGGRAGQPVPGAAGRGARLVALPPSVRRPAPRPAAQERPERVPELHRAAAAWHEQHGFADDAVRHALAAGEVDWAARLVEQHVEALLRRSEGATLRRWLAGLPDEVGRRPGAAVPGPGGRRRRRRPAGGGRAAAGRRRTRVGHQRR